MPDTNVRPLHEIAREIDRDWDRMYGGAVPYVEAMRRMTTMNDRIGYDDAKDIVLRFLTNAHNWRGDVARRIKAELKGMLK
jgi:hypothetical protein